MNQISNKIQIPIKTKIAARILTIFYGCYAFFAALLFFLSLFNSWLDRDSAVIVILAIIGAAVFLFFLYLLYKGSVGAWFLLVVSLALNSVKFFSEFIKIFAIETMETRAIFFAGLSLIGCLVNFVPLFLLTLDKKNYFAAIEKVKKEDDGAV
jgi:hypothetical protein